MSVHSPGELPVELHTHKDDNFKRKSKHRKAAGQTVSSFLSSLFFTFVVSFLLEFPAVNSVSGPVPCNRTRQVLAEQSGSIEDGPRSTNYTGNSAG